MFRSAEMYLKKLSETDSGWLILGASVILRYGLFQLFEYAPVLWW